MPIEFTPDGREIPDPTPLEMPAGYKRPESLVDMMRRLIRQDMSEYASSKGAESFEEANDFGEDEDEDDELTKYEEMADDDFGVKVKAHKEQLEKDDAEAKRRDRLQRERERGSLWDDGESDGDREEDTEQRTPHMAKRGNAESRGSNASRKKRVPRRSSDEEVESDSD